MICQKCNVNLKPDVILKNGICAFCYHRKKHWSCEGHWTTKEEAIIGNNLVCPNCERKIPNKEHLNKDKKTCKWCKNE